jgi:hypothetical protein
LRRCLVVVIAVLAATLIAVPRASAGDAPIGHVGDTLRVDTGKIFGFPNSAVVRADAALANAPAGSIVRGGYWEAYRDPVSNVVLLDKKTGYHLAQWNL